MQNDNSPQDARNESLGPIEYVSEVTESTSDHHYSTEADAYTPVFKEQKALSIFGLILSIPFPVFTVILWVTLAGLDGQGQAFGEHTMNAVFLYLVQFFILPVLSVASIIIAFIVTIKSKEIAKKIGYFSLGVTGLGLIILGIFLNH